MPLLRTSLTIVAALLAGVGSATAQTRPTGRVDGRIQGAPTAQVSRVDMNPAAVQTINLHPFRHMDIVLPYPAEWVNGGDDSVFTVVQKGNVLSLMALDLKRVETSMSIRLTDPARTILPFLVRADSTMPMVFKLEIVDPMAQQYRAVETEIASRLAAEFDARVERMAELMFQQMVMYSGSPKSIERRGSDGGGNDRVELHIHSAQAVPAPQGGATQLHLRYTIHNRSIAPVTDAFFRLQIQRERSSAFNRSQRTPLYDIRDVRTSEAVPASSNIRGVLILDMPMMDDRDAIHLEMVFHAGRRAIKLERILVGAPEPTTTGY